jgi:Fe-S cluster assembly protein SufD
MAGTTEGNKTSLLVELLNASKFTVHEPEFIRKVRKEASERSAQLPFPTARVEEWRQTSLKPLLKGSYSQSEAVSVNESEIRPFLFRESSESRIVLSNGNIQNSLSDVSGLTDGCYAGTFGNLPEKYRDKAAQRFNTVARYGEDPFVPFNTASFNDAVVIYVPKNVQIKAPLHVMHITKGDAIYTSPRVFIYAEKHSDITVVEDFIGLSDTSYFNTAVSETVLEDEAHVTHVKLQRESINAFHISRIASHLGRGSNYNSYTISIGAKLFRNEPVAFVDDENAHATLDGLVLLRGDQVADTHSVLDHLKPNCTSHQLHKVIAHDTSKSVFNGKIFVRKDSQKIDAFQENRNLLLSADATVFTKPQLEIFADDVKCSHGATIGQLSQDELFYLMSRGLSQAQATQMLTYGFALEVIDNLPIESLREQLAIEVERFANTQTMQKATV